MTCASWDSPFMNTDLPSLLIHLIYYFASRANINIPSVISSSYLFSPFSFIYLSTGQSLHTSTGLFCIMPNMATSNSSDILRLVDQVKAAADKNYTDSSPETHADLLKKINDLKLAVETPTETVLRIIYQVSI